MKGGCICSPECFAVQDTQFEHVLCVPLTFCEPPNSLVSQHCVFLCSCSKMQDQIKAVQGISMSSRPNLAGKINLTRQHGIACNWMISDVSTRDTRLCFAEFEQQLGICWHARAVKAIVLADEDWVKGLRPEDAYEYITDVQLQHDSVQLISWSSMSKDRLALSVGIHDSGWRRVIVVSDRAGNRVCRYNRYCRMPSIKHKCSHCKHVSEWQKAIDQEVNVLEETKDYPALRALCCAAV